MAIRELNPARIYVTSGNDRYYATDPTHVAKYLSSVRQPSEFLGKANGYRVTSDGEPGTGYILLKRSQLDAMDRSLSTFSITFETVGIPAPAGTVTISNLHIANALAVTGTINEKPDDIYLVEFKDNIEYAKLTALTKGYNLRTPDWVAAADYLADSLNGGGAWTWATMLADIWTNISPAVGALTTTLVSFPTSGPDNFADFGTNAWFAALHLCHSTHNRLICARAGTFHAISEGAADPTNTAYMATALTNKILLNPSHPKTHSKTTVPAAVKVFFTKRNTAFQNNADVNIVTGTEQWHSDPTYSVTVTSTAVVPALAATGVIPNTTYPLYDSMVARYDELGNLQNGAALTAQAEARATAYIDSLNAYEDARNDLYNGAVPFEIGPNFTCIHWYDFGDGIRTQTYSSPKKMTDMDAGGKEPGWPGMPDLSRHHLPFERFALGEVYNTAITPGGSGLVRVQFGTRTSGTVTTWADTGLPHEIRAHDVLNATYEVGERVVCAFHRQTSRWIIINGAGQGMVHFELTGTLALSGDAAAIILEDDGADWADTAIEIQVYDWYAAEGMWAGIAGYRGLAVYREGTHASGRPKYDIIWMEQIAQTIQYTSTEYMGYTTAGRMAVTVNWFDHQGKDPGSSVIVRDPQGQFPDVHSGAKGTAVYDYHNGYYRVISSQRVAIFGEAYLNGAACDSMIIDNFSIKPCGDHVGSPPTAPTNPLNPAVHRGLDNDIVQLRRINNTMPQPTWEVTDVAGHSYDVYIGMGRTGACEEEFCVWGDVINARLEICDAHVRRTIFCIPSCPDGQTSIEQGSAEQTSTVVHGSSAGCGEGVINPDIISGTDTITLLIQSGGPTEALTTRLIDITILSQDPCPTLTDYNTVNPRSNNLYGLSIGYRGVFCFDYSFDPLNIGYKQGIYEIYNLTCALRTDILTGADISTGPDDKEWVAAGKWGLATIGGGYGYDGEIRVSETQGAAVYVVGTGWVTMTGSLEILSLNPFHARMNFDPNGFNNDDYPSYVNNMNCGPVEVEWLEI